MQNHSTYKLIESGNEYSVLEYINDNINNKKYETNFINKHLNVKIIINEYTYRIEEGNKYHPYYNPGTPLSFTRWFKNGVLIHSHLQTIEERNS